MERFCVVCGKTSGKIIRGFCLEHFLAKNPVVLAPEEILVETEKSTGRIRHRGKWLEYSNETLGEIIKSKIKINHIHGAKVAVRSTSTPHGYLLVVEGKIDGEGVEITRGIGVKPVFVHSDSEMRLKSGYHEAIVQLRFREKTTQHKKNLVAEGIEEMLAAEKRKDALAGVSGVRERAEGIDILVGSKRAAKTVAKKLAKKYGVPVIVSFKLVGREKSGKDKKRFTYCVRV